MTGFEVVPGSLFDMSSSFSIAETEIDGLKDTIETWEMDPFAFGVLGELANYSHIYSTTVGQIRDALGKFGISFNDASDALDKTANSYADLDDSWYEKYGYDT